MYHVHFNSLTVKHTRKSSARQPDGCTPRSAVLSSSRTHRPQHVWSPVLPTYFSVSLPHFPAKVTLLAVTEDVHDLSSTVLCPLIKHPPSCQGNPERKLDTLCPERLPVPTKMKQSPSPRGGNKDENKSLHKRDLKGCSSRYTNDLLLLRAKGFKKATPREEAGSGLIH